MIIAAIRPPASWKALEAATASPRNLSPCSIYIADTSRERPPDVGVMKRDVLSNHHSDFFPRKTSYYRGFEKETLAIIMAIYADTLRMKDVSSQSLQASFILL